MKFIKKILNLVLYHILYKILDPIYIFLDNIHPESQPFYLVIHNISGKQIGLDDPFAYQHY